MGSLGNVSAWPQSAAVLPAHALLNAVGLTPLSLPHAETHFRLMAELTVGPQSSSDPRTHPGFTVAFLLPLGGPLSCVRSCSAL